MSHYICTSTLPQAGRLWCVDCESQSGYLFQFPLHSSAWSPQQTFQELLAAVVSKQWPRNTCKHLAWFTFLKFSFPRTLKYHPCYSGTCFATHTRICEHSSRSIYAILPLNDKLVMVQWVQTYQAGVSITKICCLCSAFLSAMQKAQQSAGREERCLLS